MNLTAVTKEHDHDLWPNARSGHCMCCDENFLYVFGGYHPGNDHSVYNELWRFNTSTRKWCKLPDAENKAPRCCLSSSMLLWKHSLVVFGGTSYPFGQSNSANISIYSLKTLQWYVNIDRIASDNRMINDDSSMHRVKFEKCGCYKETDVAPVPSYGQSMVINRFTDMLYIFGGTIGFVYNAEIYTFCLRNKYWIHYQFCEFHDSLKPNARYRHEAIVGLDGFFVLGGGLNEEEYGFEQIEHFSFTENNWSKKQCKHSETRFPFERVSHSCCLHNNLMYLIGGTNSNLHHMAAHGSNIWALDLKDMSWSVKGCFPYNVSFHTSTVTPFGCMYVFGGVNLSIQKRTFDLYCTSLNVPPLRRIAWLRIVELLQRGAGLSRNILRQLNLPRCFYDWIDTDVSPLTIPGA